MIISHKCHQNSCNNFLKNFVQKKFSLLKRFEWISNKNIHCSDVLLLVLWQLVYNKTLIGCDLGHSTAMFPWAPPHQWSQDCKTYCFPRFQSIGFKCYFFILFFMSKTVCMLIKPMVSLYTYFKKLSFNLLHTAHCIAHTKNSLYREFKIFILFHA